MGAVIGYFLGARTEAGGRNHYFEPHFSPPVAALAEYGGLIIHQTLDAGNRRLLHDEIREGHLDMTGARIQMLGHFFQHLAEGIHRYFTLVAVEYLDEPRHVRALEVMRQIHVHVEICDRVLFAGGPILHFDRVVDILDPHLVDRDPARVGMALHVLDGRRSGFFGKGGDGHGAMVPRGRVTPMISDDSTAPGRGAGWWA